MSSQVPASVDLAKGAICYGLNEFSVGPGARTRVENLRTALKSLAPTYKGLAQAFADYLLPTVFKTKATRQSIVDYLNTYWFDPNSPTPYFPGVMVAEIYATGVIKALELSLAADGPVIPFDSWWMLDCKQVELNSLVAQQGGSTISKYVSLMICTPRPPPIAGLAPTSPWILGKTAQAYTTRQVGRKVVTLKVRNQK